MPHKKTPVALYAILAVLFALEGAYRARDLATTVRLLLGAEPAVAWPFVPSRTSNRVRTLEAARESGLAPGDAVLAIGGTPYTGRAVLGRALERSRPGERLTVKVQRAGTGTIEDVAVPLEAAGTTGPALTFLLGLLNPMLCLALGFGVALLRPRDPRAWALLVLLLGFSHITGLRAIEPVRWQDGIRPFGVLWDGLLGGCWAIGMMLFGIYFPDRLDLDRRSPWLKWIAGAPLALLAAGNAWVGLLDSEDYASAQGIVLFPSRVGWAAVTLQMVAIGCFFASLGFRAGTETRSDARRRLRLLYWGASLGLTPIWLVFLYGLFTGKSFGEIPEWALLPALVMLPLFPITLAYVIVVERAMDVRVVLRQGLQYALAQRGVRIAQAVASIVVLLVALNLASNPDVNRPRRITYVMWGVLFVVLSQRVAERLRAFIDRRFFRDAARTEALLGVLSEKVRTIVESNRLLETVCGGVAEALLVPRVAALLPSNGAFALAHAHGFGASPPPATLAAGGPTAARLLKTKDALGVYLEDPESWIQQEPDTEQEREALRGLDTQLLLPLSLRDGLVGVLSLGAKRSEEPYTPTEVRQLASVAAQTALALENSRLTAAVAAEVARTARMNREIEIAHEVQEQLFPQVYPKVAGLEFAGRCRPASGIGGDYYDFLALESGELGIAIGDVSGKGVPAALLMAGLQASLRGQTLAGSGDLARLMDHVNRLLIDASPPNRYATFFYGQYDPATRRLAYVNAGHNAPMVLRGNGEQQQVLRLADGGPVVGLIYPAPFQEASAQLMPGDLLVGFTDGISECMNRADEEWGEERLLHAIRGCVGLPASKVIDGLMVAADAFADGAKQHDDMTLVVVQVL